MTRTACAFLMALLATQKLFPVIYQVGEFSSMGARDILDWLFSLHSLQVSLMFGLILTVVYVYPLTRLPKNISPVAGVLTGLLVGTLAFPMNLVDFGVWPEWVASSLLVIWGVVTIALWWVAIMQKRVEGSGTRLRPESSVFHERDLLEEDNQDKDNQDQRHQKRRPRPSLGA